MRPVTALLRSRALPALASLAIILVLAAQATPAAADVLVREKSSSGGIMGMGAWEGKWSVLCQQAAEEFPGSTEEYDCYAYAEHRRCAAQYRRFFYRNAWRMPAGIALRLVGGALGRLCLRSAGKGHS